MPGQTDERPPDFQRRAGFGNAGRSWVRPGVDFAHAAQAVQAAAASRMEQHGLGQVVGSVAHGDQPGAHLPGDPSQKIVADVPGRLLERTHTGFALVSVNVNLVEDAVGPHATHKVGVFVGFLTAKVVQQMRRLHGEPEAGVPGSYPEHLHQRARIRAT